MRESNIIAQFNIINKRFIKNQSKSNKNNKNTLKQDLFSNGFENNTNANDEIFLNLKKTNIIIENIFKNRSKSLRSLSKKSKRINFSNLIKSRK